MGLGLRLRLGLGLGVGPGLSRASSTRLEAEGEQVGHADEREARRAARPLEHEARADWAEHLAREVDVALLRGTGRVQVRVGFKLGRELSRAEVREGGQGGLREG